MVIESLLVITGIFIGIFCLCCCSALYEVYLLESGNNEYNLLDL
jgi:hypothetical protein